MAENKYFPKTAAIFDEKKCRYCPYSIYIGCDIYGNGLSLPRLWCRFFEIFVSNDGDCHHYCKMIGHL